MSSVRTSSASAVKTQRRIPASAVVEPDHRASPTPVVVVVVIVTEVVGPHTHTPPMAVVEPHVGGGGGVGGHGKQTRGGG